MESDAGRLDVKILATRALLALLLALLKPQNSPGRIHGRSSSSSPPGRKDQFSLQETKTGPV